MKPVYHKIVRCRICGNYFQLDDRDERIYHGTKRCAAEAALRKVM